MARAYHEMVPVSVRPSGPESPPVDWGGTERYEIVRYLGRGGMGVVYEARDRESGQTLALKTLLTATPDALYLFKREFRALADVDHPNLVRLHEFVMADDRVFFTMELVRGTDFVSYVAAAAAPKPSGQPELPTSPNQSGTRAVDRAVGTRGTETEGRNRRLGRANFGRLRPALLQLVDGVMALHAARKLHRDIKPSNVLVTAEGRVVLLDFGVAAELSRGGEVEMRERDELVGTVTYMAPEQAFEEPSPACDWYSVGVMLYESIVGRPPFVGPVMDVLTMKATVDPPAPSEYVDGIPADLDALCHALLQCDPRMRPTGTEILERLGAAAHARAEPASASGAVRPTETAAVAVLIGRETHLGALRDAFEVASTQGMITVRVGGRAGMGKSALVEWFVDDLIEKRNAIVLRGRAYEREAVPYKAIDGVVDALSRYLICLDDEDVAAVLPSDAWTVARLFPVLRRVPAIGAQVEEPIADPQRARRRGFRALREMLASLGRRRPLVLFIDDVHWGDTDSAALLLELARPPGTPHLLLVMTYREEHEQTNAFLGELEAGWPRQAEVRDLAVGPLDSVQAERLAQTLLGGEDDSRETTANAIARESAGSPFLIEELARGVVSDLQFPVHPSVDPGKGALEQMVSVRLSQLPDEARRCLELIAVSGRPVPVSIASEASELRQSPADTFMLLRSRRFIRSGMRDGREVVEVLHDRIRETIVAQLSAATVRDHHGRLAQALEAAGAADVEALATHLFGAGTTDRAFQFAERAAEQAASKLAFDQAAHLLRLAIASLPTASVEGLRLRKRLGEILEWAGRCAEAGRVYLEAVEVAPAFERVDLQRAAAEQLNAAGLMDEGTRVLRAVLATLRVWAPRTPVTAFLWYLLHLLWLRIGGLRFRQRELSVEERQRIETLNAVALGFALVDHILGVAMKARLLVVAMRAGDRANAARGAAMAALDVAGYTGPESKLEHDMRELARRLAENPTAKFTLGVTSGIGLHYRGRFRAAKEALDPLQAIVTNRRVAQHSALLFTLHSIQYLGDMAELTDRYTRALAEAEERGNLFMSVALRTSTAASVWLAADDPDRARRELREAMAQWAQKRFSSPEWRAIVSETEVDLYVGDFAGAYARVKGLSRALLRNCFFVYHTRVLVAFTQGRTAAASLHGLQGAARRTRLREAQRWTRVLKSKRMSWTAPLASILEASVALATGEPQDAHAALRAAIEGAEAVDMALHAAAARHELGVLIGGDEGAKLVQDADNAMTSLGIQVPARLAPMLVPGRAR
jgi:hypothetical protein